MTDWGYDSEEIDQWLDKQQEPDLKDKIITDLRTELAAAKAEVVSAGIEAGIAKDTLDHCYKTNDALRAKLAAERKTNATNQAAIERFRQHESELREALNPLADAKPLRRDLDVYVVAGRDVRYARMTLDAALNKGGGDE